ncbi:MAG: hypothetical protein MJZ30_03535 [Paludibacteraceae bacterium]|nr:hypothetical protein [Paludibacteraceae bacterium]
MGLSDYLKKKRKEQEDSAAESIKNYMSLVNVYIQASSAAVLNIIDLRQLPQLKVLKQKYKIPTEGGRLGLAEKKFVAERMQAEYKLPQSFFDEIDASIRKCCKKVTDLQSYGIWFQTLLQDAMTAVSLDMQVGLRLPLFLRKWMKSMLNDSMHRICTGGDFKSADLIKSAANVRLYKEKLHLSENWLSEICYIYAILARGGRMK